MNSKLQNQSTSKSPIHQRRTPQKEDSILNKTYSQMSTQILQSSKSEATLQPLSVHYAHLKDMEALGKEITQKTMQAISKPVNSSTRIQRMDNQGNQIVEEIKPAKKVCSTCLMKDLNMFPANYKFHAQCNDKSHPHMLQDPEKTGNRKIRVIKKATGSSVSITKAKLSFYKMEDMSYEPPIHSIKDLEIEKLRDDNIKLLQKIEEQEAAYQKLQINVIQKMKNLIEELINFLNQNGANLTDNAIENQKLSKYILECPLKNEEQTKQLEKLQKRNKYEFELNIQNDDLKLKLRNLQDIMYGNTYILNRQPIDQAKDNVIDSQKNRIHNQNRNITRLGDMLLKLNQCDQIQDPESKIKLLSQKCIDFSNEIEQAKNDSYASKKQMDEANSSALRYMDQLDSVLKVVQKYPLVFVSYVDKIKAQLLQMDTFEADVARAQNLLSKESLQYEETIRILKEGFQEKQNKIESLQQERQRLEDLMMEKEQLSNQKINDLKNELIELSKISKQQLESLNEKHQENLKLQEEQKQKLEEQLSKIEQDQLNIQEPSLNSSPSFFQDIYTDDNSEKVIQELTRIILNQQNFQDEESKRALRQIFGKRYLDNFRLFEKQINELNFKNKQLQQELLQEKQLKKNLYEKIECYTKLLINIHQNGLDRNNAEWLEQDMNCIQQDHQESRMAELDDDPTLLGRMSVLNGRFSEFNQLYLPPQRESRVSYMNDQKTGEINKLTEENKDLKSVISELEGKLSLLESEIQYLQLQNQQLQNKISHNKNSKEIQDLKKEVEILRKQLNEQSFLSENSKISRGNTPTRYKGNSAYSSNTKLNQFDDNNLGKNMSRLNLSSITELPQQQQSLNYEDWMQLVTIQAITIEEFLDKHQRDELENIQEEEGEQYN
ncbi:hypothetical protein ABPG74_016947 [Tetrahymena malaccensis]